MKKTILCIALAFSSYSSAQVGINTENPKTTLEVIGQPSNTNTLDGIKLPNLTKADLITGESTLYSTIPNEIGKYNPNSKGTIIYITDASALSENPKFKEITIPGAYFFDGDIWQTKSSVVTSDIIEYASTEKQSLPVFSNNNGRQKLTFKKEDVIITNGDIKLSSNGDYFNIGEDGMYQIYGYVGVFPNISISSNEISEVSAAILYERNNSQNIISEGSENFIGNMTNLVNMVIVPSSLVVLKSGDKVYFTVNFEDIKINLNSTLYSNKGYNNNTANITNEIDNITFQKYTKYITIRKI